MEGFPDPPPEDATSGPDAPDLEMFVSPMGYIDHGLVPTPKVDTLGLHMTLLRPTSTGSITLASANAFDPPVIDPKCVCPLPVTGCGSLTYQSYLSTPHDVAVLARGMRVLSRVARAAPLADIIDDKATDAAFGHALGTASDAALVEYIRTHTGTLYHPACTARMAPQAQGGVVDPRLRVHGVRGLRVVDASIFPTIVSGHTVRAHSLSFFPVLGGLFRAASLGHGFSGFVTIITNRQSSSPSRLHSPCRVGAFLFGGAPVHRCRPVRSLLSGVATTPRSRHLLLCPVRGTPLPVSRVHACRC